MPTKTKRTRADSDICRDIKRRIKVNFDVPDDRIAVKVEDGVVNLDGTVSREAARIATESCVKKVKGVRGITDRIEVEPPTGDL